MNNNKPKSKQNKQNPLNQLTREHRKEGKKINQLSKQSKQILPILEVTKPTKETRKNVPAKKVNQGVKARSKRVAKELISNVNASAKEMPALKQKGIYPQFDHFCESINPYLQALLDPWATGGAKIPEGDLPSCCFQVVERFSFTTDTAGNLFIALGVSRSLKDGSSPGAGGVYSVGNSCSLLPNVFKETDSGSSIADFSYNFGCTNFGAVDVNDIFKGTAIENLKLDVFNPSSSPAFINLCDQYRVVSCGAALTPLGSVVESKGIMYVAFVPYDEYPATETLANLTVNDLTQLPYTASIPLNSVKGGTVLYRPTDDLNFQYTPVGKDGSYFSLEEDGSASPGGLWFFVKDYEANAAFELSVVVNYEILPNSANFAPGLEAVVPDDFALQHAQDVLLRMPACFEGSGLAQHSTFGGTKGSGAQAKAHATLNTNRVNDHSFKVSGSTIKVAGPQPMRLGGIKDVVGGAVSAFNKYRPMLSRIINEWGPIAAKLAMAGVALL